MIQQLLIFVCTLAMIGLHKMAVMFIIILFKVYASGLIVNPPADTTGIVEGMVQFECEVTSDQLTIISWEFNGIIIYSFFGGMEDYPLGTNKYTVTLPGNLFTLFIKDLTFDDGGLYTCSSISSSATAILLVLGTPSLTFYPPKPVEGDTVLYTCDAQFGGPSKDISLGHYPKLRMFFSDRDDEEELQVKKEGSYHHLSKQYNVSVDASMNGNELACEIGTSRPAMNLTSFIEMNIIYSVRNTNYKPYQDKYQIGSTITCMADGNPLPSFDWENVAQPGEKIYGKVLNITESMIGQNMWRCTSTNIIDKIPHNTSTMVVFTAIHPTDYKETIVVLLYVTLLMLAPLGIIVCVLVCPICIKKLRKKHTTHQASRANDASRESAIPLLKINEEKRPLTSFQCMKKIEEIETKEDLDEHGDQIREALKTNGKMIIEDFPKILFEILRKANNLIESGHFINIVQTISKIYGDSPYKLQDGALDIMIDLFTEKEYGNLFKNQDKLLELCREILPADKCHNCRANFLSAFIRHSEYITDSPFYIKWTKDYIKTLKHLLINGADSRWAPGNQQGISEKYTAQYLFFGAIPNILLYNNDLFDDLMDIIPSFISQASFSATNIGGSPLRAFVESTCTYLYVESLQPQQSQQSEQPQQSQQAQKSEQPQQSQQAQLPASEVLKKYVEVVSKVVEVDGALVDKTDPSGRTPLQQFLKFVKWNADFLEYIQIIISMLKSDTSINGKDRNGWTVMHCLAEAFPVFHKPANSEGIGAFVDIVKQLKTDVNIDMQDIEGRTALHVLAEKCNKEILEIHEKAYCVFLRLFSTNRSIVVQDKHRCTAVHILVRRVAVEPDLASDLLPVLKIFITSQNVNVVDEQSTTPYSWILNGKTQRHDEDSRLIETLSEIENLCLINSANAELAEKGFSFIHKYLGSYKQTIATQHSDGRLIELDDYIRIPQRYYYFNKHRSNLSQLISLHGLLDKLTINYVITRRQRNLIQGGPHKSESEQTSDMLDLVMNIPEKAKYLAFLEVLAEDYEDQVDLLTDSHWGNI